MLEAIGLAFGLAMDATAVAAARGVSRSHKADVVILPAVFGGFQAAMVAIGWAIGKWGGAYMAAAEKWIAFGLLLLLGGKMVIEAVRGGGEDAEPKRTGVGLYVALGVATSVDAAAAGLTLPLLATPPVISIILVGTITAACSLAGYLAGRAVGGKFGQRLEILGGLVLIALAIRLAVAYV